MQAISPAQRRGLQLGTLVLGREQAEMDELAGLG